MNRTMRSSLLASLCGAAATLLLLLFSAGPASALSIADGAWQWQNPLPQGSGYSDGYFLDAGHGWLISGGTIYHTTDGGLTLTVQAAHNVSFSAITFVGARHGWAVGYPAGPKGTAILYRTVNGGATWTRVRLRWQGGIRDVGFATTQVGWATINHRILHTTDGGRFWTAQVLGLHQQTFAVQALSARHAWIAEGGNTLLQTVDGGRGWRAVQVAHGVALTLVEFKGSRYGWAGSAVKAGPIVHTTDGGRHWTVQLSAGRVSDFSFADPHDGWAIAGGKTYHTTDGGSAWQLQTNAPDSSWVDALTAGDAFIGAPAGFTTGGLSGTTDGGATWQPSVSAAGGYYGLLTALQFSDAQHGWAVGDGGEILATTDGGATWTAQASNTGLNLTGVHFSDAQDGWAVGDQGAIINTTNGGSAWTAQSAGTGDDLTGVTFTDAHDGWATGQSFTPYDDYSGGFILHTTNGGQDWTRQYDSPYDPTTMTPGVAFNAIAFADAHDGWAVGETQGSDKGYNSFVIMHTSNGGATWTQQLDYNSNAGGNEDDATLTSVACTSAENAVAVGYDDNGAAIWHTANGGQAWTRVGQKLWPADNFVNLTDVAFGDATHGWAIGAGNIEVDPFADLPVRYVGSTIIRTTDGGATWSKQLVPSDADAEPLDALSFVGPTHGWVAGDGGDILATTSGGNAP
jgi:photosystem II stability/assembly factor-like uncharacterized protein